MEETLTLTPMTREMYHAYFKEYENDPALFLDRAQFRPYTYSEEEVERYIRRQLGQKRKTLAVMYGNEIIGEIVIKNIEENKSATLSISMKNARHKNRGFGTEAERLAVRYVFEDLDIPTLYADALRTNTRSQHVMEKLGFQLVGEDETFRYYRIERPNRPPCVTARGNIGKDN